MKKNLIKILLIVLIISLLVPSVLIAGASKCDDVIGANLEYHNRKSGSITKNPVVHSFTAKYTGLHKIAVTKADKLYFDEASLKTNGGEIYAKTISSNNHQVYTLRLFADNTYEFRVKNSSSSKVKYNINVYKVQDSINSKELNSASYIGQLWDTKEEEMTTEKIFDSFAWRSTVMGRTPTDPYSRLETDFRFYLNRNDLTAVYLLVGNTPKNLSSAVKKYWDAQKSGNSNSKKLAIAELNKQITDKALATYKQAVGIASDVAQDVLEKAGYKKVALLVPIAEMILSQLGNPTPKTAASKIYDIIKNNSSITRDPEVCIIDGLCLVLKTKYTYKLKITNEYTFNGYQQVLTPVTRAYITGNPEVSFERWSDHYSSKGSQLYGAQGQMGKFSRFSSSGLNDLTTWATSNTGFIDLLVQKWYGGRLVHTLN